MNGKIHRDVGGEIDEGPDRGECIPQRCAKILAAMCREEDGPQLGKVGGRRRLRGGDFEQRVDHRVAGTRILSREMFSRVRFCAAADVGAQCRDVDTAIERR